MWHKFGVKAHWRFTLALLAVSLPSEIAGPLRAQQLPAELTPVDRRLELARPPVPLPPERLQALERLRERLPEAEVQFDDVVRSPRFVHSRSGFLTAPDGVRPVGSLEDAPVRIEPRRIIGRFIDEHAVLFGHGAGLLDSARVTREFTNTHSGLTTVVWQQQLDGVLVFDAVLAAHVTSRGELVNLSSLMVPDLEAAAGMAAVERMGLVRSPPVAGAEALGRAAANIGVSWRAESLERIQPLPEGIDRQQQFRHPALRGAAAVKLVWLPLSRDVLRLAWKVTLTGKEQVPSYLLVVDAGNADVLLRHSMTSYANPVTYKHFGSDSPTPLSPGWDSPCPPLPPQPAWVDRVSTRLVALSGTASPAGWIDTGYDRTRGNNVDAYLDLNDADPLVVDDNSALRPKSTLVNGELVFDFTLDPTQPPPQFPVPAPNEPPYSTAQQYHYGAVVNVFYWVNWAHDRFYELGFTEAAANFQKDNFGRGGSGNDEVRAEVHNNFGGTPAYGWWTADNSTQDGPNGAPRLELWASTSNLKNYNLDTEIILHELTHGLTQRMVNKGAVMYSQAQPVGLGEGWSDFYPLALLSEGTDELHGNYAMNAYLAAPGGPPAANYYFGYPHRYPYTTEMTRNPLTFENIDPNHRRCEWDYDDNTIFCEAPYNVPCLDPVSWDPTGIEHDSQHAVGEVWAVTLWDARANLIEKHGFEVGNELILRLVTDGLNLAPSNPNFIQARDAILQADRVLTGGANLHELWEAFAKRGMGWSAVAPPYTTTTGVDEEFDLPPRGNQVWTGPYVTGNAISGSPAIGADGTIYVGSWDGKIYAVNPNRTTRWVYPPSGSLSGFRGSPAVGPNGAVYIGCLNNRMYCITAGGAFFWSYLTGGQIYSTPGFGADGTVYFGSRNGRVYALDPLFGQPKLGWPVTLGGYVDSSPAVAPDGTVYIAAQSSLHARLPNGQAKAGWPKATGNTIWASPAIARDGTVYVGSTDGKLYAWNPDGTAKWTYNTGLSIRSSPAIGPEGNLYFGTDGGTVVALYSSGALLWTRSAGYFIDSSPAVDASGKVIIGSWNGVVYALRPEDGATEWAFSTGGLVQSPPTIFTNGVVYVGNGAGNLYALQNVSGPAPSDWSMFRQNVRHTGNPATLTMSSGVRLGDLDFQFQLRGLSGMTCQIEGSDNLFAWNPLPKPAQPTLITLPAGGVATFMDTNASGYAHRFYRVRSGAILSYNSLGCMTVTVPAGSAMIANQVQTADNDVHALFAGVPNNTAIHKYNPATGGYLTATFVDGQWEGDDFEVGPGEGVFIDNPLPGPLAVAFVGELLQGRLLNPVLAGSSVRSSMVPQTGVLDVELGYPVAEGDSVSRYNNATGGYITDSFVDGLWEGDDPPPRPRVGESFWITTSAAKAWVREFSVWNP